MTGLALLLAVACSSRGAEPEGFDAALPEFADDGHISEPLVNRGDVAQRPPSATVANLAVSGVDVDIVGGTCVATDLGLPGGFGFQAAVAQREGSLSVDVEPRSGDGEVELFLDGELVPTTEPVVRYEDGAWQVLSPAGEVEGRAAPEVLVTFSCPGPIEERFQGDPGVPDVTPDPGRVGSA